MVPLAKHGNGQDGCRIPGPGSSWRASQAREVVVRQVRVIAGALVAVLAAIAAAPARADILVGVAAPLTGPYEWSGEQTQHAVELAAEELNAAGGLLGQRVTLTFADDYCAPDQAVAAARKLVADKVVVAMGHNCSGAAIPAAGVYEAAHVPFVTGHPSNPLLTDRGLRFTFRI